MQYREMGSIRLVSLLLLSYLVWVVTCIPSQDKFLQCMSTLPPASQILHTQDSSSYTPLLQSTQQNPRWLNSPNAKPLLIVTPQNESEIQKTVLCSREQGLQIRVRSGGHDYEGLSYLCNNPFVIIDLINLRSTTVDIESKTAWVQTGATLGELYYSIAQKSQVHAFPAGICPSVGTGGHISGGGLGSMTRKYALAADNIVDARLVDYYGRILDRKAMGEDLFWAIRGGGGASFGVITSWKIKLVQVPPLVTVFTVNTKSEGDAKRLVNRWQHLASKLPEDLFIRTIIQSKNKMIEASFQSMFLGRISDLIPLMKRSFPELDLKATDCTEMKWIQSVLYFSSYPSLDSLLNRTVLFKGFFKAKSDFVKEPIPENGLDGIWKKLAEDERGMMILEPLGGKMDAVSEQELPFPHRKGNLYNIQYFVKWEVDGIAEESKHVNWTRLIYNYMTPYVSSSPRASYFNYKDLDLGINRDVNNTYSHAKVWGEKYFKTNFKRLATVKAQVDPTNFFRNEQSIPPFSSHG